VSPRVVRTTWCAAVALLDHMGKFMRQQQSAGRRRGRVPTVTEEDIMADRVRICTSLSG
jgi:hypothetical protein